MGILEQTLEVQERMATALEMIAKAIEEMRLPNMTAAHSIAKGIPAVVHAFDNSKLELQDEEPGKVEPATKSPFNFNSQEMQQKAEEQKSNPAVDYSAITIADCKLYAEYEGLSVAGMNDAAIKSGVMGCIKTTLQEAGIDPKPSLRERLDQYMVFKGELDPEPEEDGENKVDPTQMFAGGWNPIFNDPISRYSDEKKGAIDEVGAAMGLDFRVVSSYKKRHEMIVEASQNLSDTGSNEPHDQEPVKQITVDEMKLAAQEYCKRRMNDGKINAHALTTELIKTFGGADSVANVPENLKQVLMNAFENNVVPNVPEESGF